MNLLLLLAVLPLATQTDRPEHASDEPPRGVSVKLDGAHDGYTLLAPLRSKTTYLVDANGDTVHQWPSEYSPGNSAYLLDDGSILRCAKFAGEAPFRGGGEGGRIQRITWDGELVWDYEMASERLRQHHDIEPLPNGNVLAIIWHNVEQDAAIDAGRDASAAPEDGLWPDAIFELKPVGADDAEVVWQWLAWDHLVQDRDPEKSNYGDPAKHPHRIDVNFDVEEAPAPKSDEDRAKEEAEEERLRGLGYLGGDAQNRRSGRGPRQDWLHTNGIDYDPATDLIAISVRQASEVWIIDHSTTTEEARTGEGGRYGKGGDLLHRFGNPSAYGSNDPRRLFNQHDAQFFPSKDGLRMTVFNNGNGRDGGDRSSVDEYLLPFDAAKGFTPGAHAELVWSWNGGDEELYNGHICGAQRLATGNTLMCMGEDGRVLEITPTGDVVWDWRHPFRATESRGDRGGRGGDGERRRGGGPPRADGPPRGGSPPGGGPPGRDGARGRRGGGGGPMSAFGVFRVTRYDRDHPAFANL